MGTVTIDPGLMAILSSKINSISKQMSYIVQKSARSSVMGNARDFSTAICDGSGDVIALPNGFPVHATNMGVTCKAIFEFHEPESLKPGDAILNNSPYHGNTHMADHTIIVPVFFEDEIMFFTTVRGHQADIGNSIPTTYHGLAKDIYEEGALCFPAVKVQSNYRDIEDIIRMCRMRIRVPEVWYGDFSAMVGAARIGERELKKLIDKYGKETIKAFCREWQEYGNRRMKEEIKNLPTGTWTYENCHDPIPGVLLDGVNIKVNLTIDSEKEKIIVDFTENGDPVACGLNLCEATVLAAGRSGVLNFVNPNLPLCEGTFSRIEVKMKDKGVIGKASFPHSSATATTNLFERAIYAVQGAFNKVNENFGMAEGASISTPTDPVISGVDSRTGRPFVTQLLSGCAGGMGVLGHDGYVTLSGICTGGLQAWNSMEIIEQKYPILYEMQEIIQDSVGAGKWDGAPGVKVAIQTREDHVRFAFICDGKYNPPRGAKGGKDGTPINIYKYPLSNQTDITEISPMLDVQLVHGEVYVAESSSGGGYGDPLERDPEIVRHRVREGWVSFKKAEDVYGIKIDATGELYEVNYKETEELRARKKEVM